MTIRRRFRQSIKCGTGEAYFILQDNPRMDFSKEIIKASLNNLAYDGQAEGDRAYYLAGLINLSSKKDKIVNSILNALGKECRDTWALDQLFHLAAIFAKEGNKKARQAIYKRYSKNIIIGSEWCGEDALVELDHFEGLKYIAETRGKHLSKNPDDWEDSLLVDLFQKENPEIKVHQELKKSAKINLYIKKYLETIKKHKWSGTKRRQRTKFNYKKVKENIENKKVVPVPRNSIKDLKKFDIKNLADDFLQEKNPVKQEKYLRVFALTKFPFSYQPILQIAKRRNCRGTRLIEFACEALSHFEAMDIRQFAIQKLNKANNPADYLPLLVANYQKGDWKLLRTIAAKYKDENIIHSLVWGFIDIYKSNRTKECKKPLEIIYEKLTCGIHRNEILEILHNNKSLSTKVLKEMKYDSYDGTRKLYEQINAKKAAY
jgi:hypothetical protein